MDNINTGACAENSQTGNIMDGSFTDDVIATQAYLVPEGLPSCYVDNSPMYSSTENHASMDYDTGYTINLGESNTSIGFIAEVVPFSSGKEEIKDVGSIAERPFIVCAGHMLNEENTENCKNESAESAEESPKNCGNNVDVGSPPSFCETEVDLKSIAGNPSNSEEDNTDMPTVFRNPHNSHEDRVMSRNLYKQGGNDLILGMIIEDPAILGRDNSSVGAVVKTTPPSSSVEADISVDSEVNINGHMLSSNIVDSGNAGFTKEKLSTNKVLSSVENVVVDGKNMESVKESSSSHVEDNVHATQLLCGIPVGSARGVRKTELESEMEFYEEAEKEEQASLLSSLRVDEGMEPSSQAIIDTFTVDTESAWKRSQEMELTERRSKRGRKSQVNLWEDVCFVCFDGGKLILCDRRSCPKAYHVECTGRDSDFFEKKGAWFCGWHFCAICSKSATMHCYTCSNALCSNCIKDADFLCIRKNRGLCDSCFPIVKMIEGGETVNADGVQVDFNDEETYEYLYKGYWEDLKSKISLTWEEVEEAQKAEEAGEQFLKNSFNDTDHISEGHDGSGSDFDDVPTMKCQRQSKRKRYISLSFADDDGSESDYNEGDEEEEDDIKPKKGHTKLLEFDGWATRQLFDFLQLRKEDQKKPLALVAVTKVLWSYIEDNGLQHPRRRGQIICDEKLQKLFGKKSVGRFEMTKLLSSHLAPKRQKSSKTIFDDDITEINHSEERWAKGSSEKHRRPRKKSDENRYFKADLNEFAAISVQNINLIYLRRALLEDLLDDTEFSNKVIGAFVRIRVPGMGNKNDAFYRLVQVVGIKLSTPRSPDKTPDIVLEILNLQKREEVTIDQVSNQDFTEEECQRLRQCIKYGFIKAMTVGELEEKAKSLQEVKVKDWIDTELLRLSHLRDRASEKGRKRELRECVEKLQLLSSLEEKERRLKAPLQITTDPHMDPDFDSDTEEKDKQGDTNEPPSSWEKGHAPRAWSVGISEKTSSQWEANNNSISEAKFSSWDNTKVKSAAWGHKDFGRGRGVDYNGGKKSASWIPALCLEDKNRFDLNKREFESISWNTDLGRNQENDNVGWANQSKFTKSDNVSNRGIDPLFKKDDRSGHSRMGAYGETPVLEPSEWPEKRDEMQQVTSTVGLANTGLSAAAATPIQMISSLLVVDEKEKIWHYQDPTGKIQGPFSMEQLRKWEKTKLFPLDLKIWKASESQAESILLMDALAAKFSKNSSSIPLLQPAVAVENYSQAGWPGVAFSIDHQKVPMTTAPKSDQREPCGVVSWDQNGATVLSSTWNSNSNDKIAPGDGGWTTKLQHSSTAKSDDGWGAPIFNVEESWGQHLDAGKTGAAEEGWGLGSAQETGCWEPKRVPEIGGWGRGRAPEAEGWGPGKLPEPGGWGPGNVSEAGGHGHCKMPDETQGSVGWRHRQLPETGGWGHAKAPELRGAGGWGHSKMPEELQEVRGWGPGKAPGTRNWAHAKIPEEAQVPGGWGPAKVPDTRGLGPSQISEAGQGHGGWGPGKMPESGSWGHAKMVEGQEHRGLGLGKASDVGGWRPGKVPETGGWGHGSMPAQEPGGWGRSGFTAEDGAGGQIAFRQGRGHDLGYQNANQFRNDKPGFELRNPRKKDIPCKFFGRGVCRKGPACEFKHAELDL